jgi:hypothetical protein
MPNTNTILIYVGKHNSGGCSFRMSNPTEKETSGWGESRPQKKGNILGSPEKIPQIEIKLANQENR